MRDLQSFNVWQELFNDTDFVDVRVVVESGCEEELWAHRNVLASASPVLRMIREGSVDIGIKFCLFRDWRSSNWISRPMFGLCSTSHLLVKEYAHVRDEGTLGWNHSLGALFEGASKFPQS
eukprot:6014285-Amphidinium_carterae.2